MSSLRVNKIIDEAGTGPVEFTKGVTFPSGASIPESNITINTTGTVTTSDIVINENIEVVGVMTARSGGKFVGSGFNITNPPGTPSGKVIGLYLIS